ncbi:hypothetical protein M407DRAFT_7870 [Tulasnella calospora MUT 4182]|uniref:Uncharacterized protein n=1 Tax=Tulasnella calospora MUT 4182 TaxID=1051891 RepID=A0A0C3LY82_9AGAM|nr:hypothetical protein M407DRAFT_7870 [Tulasnella calospora MUT 4182]
MDEPYDAVSALETPESVGLRGVKDIAFGSVAGMASKVFEHPFDLCKVRLQAQVLEEVQRFKGPVDCLTQTWQSEGIRGLYRGLPLPLFGAILENAALFMTYNQLQIGIKKITGRSGDLSLGEKAIAAAGGGTVASFILTPLELIKCKMQVQMMAAEAKRLAAHSSEPLPPIDHLDAELAEAEGQLDGVNKRRAELEEDRIPQLEKELEALTKELETVDKGSSVNLPTEFNHEIDYPHHYQTPPVPHPGSFHPYRNPGQRNNRLAPIQRPPGQGPIHHYPGANPSFSSSQRSLEGPDPSGRGAGPSFYPAGGPAPFPQIRHPSVNAHPAPRGLFSNANHPSGTGVQRPVHVGGRRRPGNSRTERADGPLWWISDGSVWWFASTSSSISCAPTVPVTSRSSWSRTGS